ncbi:MAG: hypothetical protein QME81_17550 [bacterium]|nr:hypothetical protein [bacterium]
MEKEEQERLIAEIQVEMEKIRVYNIQLQEMANKLESHFKETRFEMEAKVAELEVRVNKLEKEVREKLAALKEKVYRELAALRAEVQMNIEARDAFEHLRTREDLFNDFLDEGMSPIDPRRFH